MVPCGAIKPDGVPVQYIHVPKTGGTSLDVTWMQVADSQSIPFHRCHFANCFGDVSDRGAIYSGHHAIGWYDARAGANSSPEAYADAHTRTKRSCRPRPDPTVKLTAPSVARRLRPLHVLTMREPLAHMLSTYGQLR